MDFKEVNTLITKIVVTQWCILSQMFRFNLRLNTIRFQLDKQDMDPILLTLSNSVREYCKI